MPRSEHHDPRPDAQLVADANRGDETAFAALYLRHRDFVFRLARRVTGNDDDALDALQETFHHLLRQFPGFALTANMRTYLYPVVRFRALTIRNKRTRARGKGEPHEALAAAPSPASNPGESGMAELAAALADLPEDRREILLMRHVDGMSIAEIAAALAIPEGTAKSRLHHALAALRDDPRARRFFGPE